MSRAVLAVLLALLTGGATAQQLVADLSNHLIAIATDFTGAEVVLFGAVEEPGDVVIIVKGPPQTVTVRRKERMGGLWLNRESMTFADVPSYYSVASSQPIENFAGSVARERHGIGTAYLPLAPREADAPPARQRAFRRALIEQMEAAGVYAPTVGQVLFLGPRLFRTNIAFPANVPTGRYEVQVLLFRDGEVVDAAITPLQVSQIGIGAQIHRFAQQNAAAYGAVAIAVAVLAGWAASAAFRRI